MADPKSPTRPVLALCVAALLAVAAAGCGGSSHSAPTPRDQVRTTLVLFQRATARKDFQTLCDRVLARELIRHLDRLNVPCEIGLERSVLALVKQPKLTVLGVDVHGQRATARVRTTAIDEPASTDVVQLVREGGAWKIAALGAPAPGGGTGASPPTTPPSTTPTPTTTGPTFSFPTPTPKTTPTAPGTTSSPTTTAPPTTSTSKTTTGR